MSLRSPLRAPRMLLVALPCAIACAWLARIWATRPKEASPALEPAPMEPEPTADWCVPGFEATEGGCIALPSGSAPTALVVYLHGRYAPDAAANEVDRQRRLASHAVKKGYAVLATRSRLGLCSDSELAGWFCWPTTEAAADAEALQRWERVVEGTQRRVGATRRYLLGFSSGGYYAGMIASHAWVPFDAVAVAHAGPVEPVRPAGPMPPMLLLSADDDVAQVDMMRFEADLQRSDWPHDAYARSGAHDLADSDIDAALSFFARSREPMPLQPPLALHRPALHLRDAGAGPDGGESHGEASNEEAGGTGAAEDDPTDPRTWMRMATPSQRPAEDDASAGNRSGVDSAW